MSSQPLNKHAEDPGRSEWLTAKEAAEHLRAKPRSVILWARQGRIKGHRLSCNKRSVWRFRREDLDAALSPGDGVLKSTLSSAGSATGRIV